MREFVMVNVGGSDHAPKWRAVPVQRGLAVVPARPTTASVFVNGERIASFHDGASAQLAAAAWAGLWGFTWGKTVTAKVGGLTVFETFGEPSHKVIEEADE